MNRILKPKTIFILINLLTTIILTLYLIDKIKGDGDGVVRGIAISDITYYLTIITVIFDYIFLFRLKIAWIQNMLLSCTMLVLTLLFLEWFFGLMLNFRSKQTDKSIPVLSGPNYAVETDSIVGYRLPANLTLNYVKKRRDEVVYDSKFSTNKDHLRITPTDSIIDKDKYAAFFGCSFTFGEGLQSNETSSYYFQSQNPSFQPYNFGNSAYGPHQMLALLQSGRAKKIVKEKNGIAFYTYMSDHINRAVGGTNSFTNTGGNAPYFALEDGKIVRHGLFNNGHSKLKVWFYNLIFNSNICRYFSIGYPFWMSDSEYKFIAELLIESAAEYKRQFGNDNFYVVFYPDQKDYATKIIEHLKGRNIKYLDYTKLFDHDLPQYHIKYDKHPSALANQTLVKQIIKDVKPDSIK